MIAVLQEILVMPNTPTSLIGMLVEKLIGLLRDDAQKIQMVSPCGNIILLKKKNHLFMAAWDCVNIVLSEEVCSFLWLCQR